jgi:hypothetical protein
LRTDCWETVFAGRGRGGGCGGGKLGDFIRAGDDAVAVAGAVGAGKYFRAALEVSVELPREGEAGGGGTLPPRAFSNSASCMKAWT